MGGGEPRGNGPEKDPLKGKHSRDQSHSLTSNWGHHNDRKNRDIINRGKKPTPRVTDEENAEIKVQPPRKEAAHASCCRVGHQTSSYPRTVGRKKEWKRSRVETILLKGCRGVGSQIVAGGET